MPNEPSSRLEQSPESKVGTAVTAALIMAQSVLRRWADLYARLANESGPLMERKMDYVLPPADHVRTLEAIEVAIPLSLVPALAPSESAQRCGQMHPREGYAAPQAKTDGPSDETRVSREQSGSARGEALAGAAPFSSDKPSQSPYSLGYNELAERVVQLERELAEARSSLSHEATVTELDDVLAWADGVRGALGSEHAAKVTAREARIAAAIAEAFAPSAKATVGVDLASGPDSWACSCGASTSSPKCRDPHFNCPTESRVKGVEHG